MRARLNKTNIASTTDASAQTPWTRLERNVDVHKDFPPTGTEVFQMLEKVPRFASTSGV